MRRPGAVGGVPCAGMAMADAHPGTTDEDAPEPHGGAGAPDVTIRAEAPGEEPEVRILQAAAFGDPDRVPGLVDELRGAPAALAPLSFVAVADSLIVGHVMLSACWLDALPRLVDVYSLSPLGVRPEYQGRGIGTRLTAHALAAADARRVPLVFLEGSPRFYGERGFRPAEELGFRPPTLRYPPGAFQVATLSAHEEWMTGTFVYSRPFWAHDCVGLRGRRLESANSRNAVR